MGVRMELAEACVIEDDVMIVLAAERGMPAGHGRPGCRGRKRQDSAATVSQKVNKPRSTRVAEGSRKGLPDSLSLCLSASRPRLCLNLHLNGLPLSLPRTLSISLFPVRRVALLGAVMDENFIAKLRTLFCVTFHCFPPPWQSETFGALGPLYLSRIPMGEESCDGHLKLQIT